MSTYSDVYICNLALAHIKQAPITSLSDNSFRAQQCSQFYDTVRDEVLRSAWWKFAGKVETLSLISNEIVDDWDYLYTYPSNCLFIRRVDNEYTIGLPESPPFEEIISPDTNVKAIACNLESASIRFTKKTIDPTLYDPSFVMALSMRLAAFLAPSLAGDEKIAQSKLATYEILISEAKRFNSSEGQQKKERQSSYVNER